VWISFELITECAREMPERERQNTKNFNVDAVKILFWKYYPQFNEYNLAFELL